MTTIIGLKTNDGEESIVLSADTQITFFNGDVAFRKMDFSKIRTGKNYALAYVGNLDKYVDSFFSYLKGRRDFESYIKFLSDKRMKQPEDMLLSGELLSERNPLEDAIRRGYFAELNLLNTFATIDDEDDENGSGGGVELIMISNFPSESGPELKLHRATQYGILVPSSPKGELEYFALGSGKEIAKSYIDEMQWEDDSRFKKKIPMDEIDTANAIRIAIGAQKRAMRDASTGGVIELAVLRASRLDYYGDDLRKALEEAESAAYERIIAHYEKEEEK